MRRIRIGTRKIGDGHPCFIIAEAGSNHNGSLAMARRLIDVAARAGADAVKFQTFRASRIYTPLAGRSEYLKLRKPIYDIIREMEMPYEWIPRLAEHCRRRGLEFLSTPFDEESAERLAPFLEAFKIASYELTHEPLIRHVARYRKPILLSTGASTVAEIGAAVQLLRRLHRGYALLQCTASYPAPLGSLNVRVIESFKRAFGCPAGLSDHSRDPIAGPMAAVALGANVIEKHFTLRNDLPGPDHRFAVTPVELGLLVRRVREVEEARGDGRKAVHPVEKELRRFARRSVFALRDLARGEQVRPGDVAVLRNGSMPPGLPPGRLASLMGRKLRQAVKAGHPLPASAVEW